MEEQLLATLLARQGIYDKTGSVYAYELLYRNPIPTPTKAPSGEEMTSLVITQLFSNLEIDKIIGNKPAFINFTYAHLVQQIPKLLPKDRIVIEVLESVEVDNPLINSLFALKELGYKIALDDFIFNEKTSLLVELADIIKLDVLYQNKQQIAQQLQSLAHFKGELLAEKIENEVQYAQCVDLGFTYFQGFFFHKPEAVKCQQLTENKANLIRLLTEFNNEHVTMEQLEEHILQLPKLSYRILRLANSVYLYRSHKIMSIIDAMRHLGLNQIYNCLCLFLVSSQNTLIPDILEKTLIRAKMCECLAKASCYPDPHQAYTVGIFSTLDKFLKEPMDLLLSKVQLSPVLNEALLYYRGELGTLLQITIDYEFSRFKKLEDCSFSQEDLTRSYLYSIEYATSVMSVISK